MPATPTATLASAPRSGGLVWQRHPGAEPGRDPAGGDPAGGQRRRDRARRRHLRLAERRLGDQRPRQGVHHPRRGRGDRGARRRRRARRPPPDQLERRRRAAGDLRGPDLRQRPLGQRRHRRRRHHRSAREATFVGCVFQNNSNTSNTGGGGTVVAVGSKAFFSDCQWSNNSARTTAAAWRSATESRADIHDSRCSTTAPICPTISRSRRAAASTSPTPRCASPTPASTATTPATSAAGCTSSGAGRTRSRRRAPRRVVANCTFVDNGAARRLGQLPGADRGRRNPRRGSGDAARLQLAPDHKQRPRWRRHQHLPRGGRGRRQRPRGQSRHGTGPNGFGGAISTASNDGNDGTTNNGAINRRSATLTMRDTLVRGRFGGVGTVAQVAGGIYVGGDNNRQYGLNGVTQMGTAATNRATATLAERRLRRLRRARDRGPDRHRRRRRYPRGPRRRDADQQHADRQRRPGAVRLRRRPGAAESRPRR